MGLIMTAPGALGPVSLTYCSEDWAPSPGRVVERQTRWLQVPVRGKRVGVQIPPRPLMAKWDAQVRGDRTVAARAGWLIFPDLLLCGPMNVSVERSHDCPASEKDTVTPVAECA